MSSTIRLATESDQLKILRDKLEQKGIETIGAVPADSALSYFAKYMDGTKEILGAVKINEDLGVYEWWVKKRAEVGGEPYALVATYKFNEADGLVWSVHQNVTINEQKGDIEKPEGFTPRYSQLSLIERLEERLKHLGLQYGYRFTKRFEPSVHFYLKNDQTDYAVTVNLDPASYTINLYREYPNNTVDRREIPALDLDPVFEVTTKVHEHLQKDMVAEEGEEQSAKDFAKYINDNYPWLIAIEIDDGREVLVEDTESTLDAQYYHILKVSAHFNENGDFERLSGKTYDGQTRRWTLPARSNYDTIANQITKIFKANKPKEDPEIGRPEGFTPRYSKREAQGVMAHIVRHFSKWPQLLSVESADDMVVLRPTPAYEEWFEEVKKNDWFAESTPTDFEVIIMFDEASKDFYFGVRRDGDMDVHDSSYGPFQLKEMHDDIDSYILLSKAITGEVGKDTPLVDKPEGFTPRYSRNRKGQMVVPVELERVIQQDVNLFKPEYKSVNGRSGSFIVHLDEDGNGNPRIMVAPSGPDWYNDRKLYSDPYTEEFIADFHDDECDNTDFNYYGRVCGDLWRRRRDINDPEYDELDERLDTELEAAGRRLDQGVYDMVKMSLPGMLNKVMEDYNLDSPSNDRVVYVKAGEDSLVPPWDADEPEIGRPEGFTPRYSQQEFAEYRAHTDSKKLIKWLRENYPQAIVTKSAPHPRYPSEYMMWVEFPKQMELSLHAYANSVMMPVLFNMVWMKDGEVMTNAGGMTLEKIQENINDRYSLNEVERPEGFTPRYSGKREADVESDRAYIKKKIDSNKVSALFSPHGLSLILVENVPPGEDEPVIGVVRFDGGNYQFKPYGEAFNTYNNIPDLLKMVEQYIRSTLDANYSIMEIEDVDRPEGFTPRYSGKRNAQFDQEFFYGLADEIQGMWLGDARLYVTVFPDEAKIKVFRAAGENRYLEIWMEPWHDTGEYSYANVQEYENDQPDMTIYQYDDYVIERVRDHVKRFFSKDLWARKTHQAVLDSIGALGVEWERIENPHSYSSFNPSLPYAVHIYHKNYNAEDHEVVGYRLANEDDANKMQKFLIDLVQSEKIKDASHYVTISWSQPPEGNMEEVDKPEDFTPRYGQNNVTQTELLSLREWLRVEYPNIKTSDFYQRGANEYLFYIYPRDHVKIEISSYKSPSDERVLFCFKRLVRSTTGNEKVCGLLFEQMITHIDNEFGDRTPVDKPEDFTPRYGMKRTGVFKLLIRDVTTGREVFRWSPEFSTMVDALEATDQLKQEYNDGIYQDVYNSVAEEYQDELDIEDDEWDRRTEEFDPAIQSRVMDELERNWVHYQIEVKETANVDDLEEYLIDNGFPHEFIEWDRNFDYLIVSGMVGESKEYIYRIDVYDSEDGTVYEVYDYSDTEMEEPIEQFLKGDEDNLLQFLMKNSSPVGPVDRPEDFKPRYGQREHNVDFKYSLWMDYPEGWEDRGELALYEKIRRVFQGIDEEDRSIIIYTAPRKEIRYGKVLIQKGEASGYFYTLWDEPYEIAQTLDLTDENGEYKEGVEEVFEDFDGLFPYTYYGEDPGSEIEFTIDGTETFEEMMTAVDQKENELLEYDQQNWAQVEEYAKHYHETHPKEIIDRPEDFTPRYGQVSDDGVEEIDRPEDFKPRYGAA